jgi:putative hydrolase of the HAD superfamily
MSDSQGVNAADIEPHQPVAAAPKYVLIIDADNTLWDTNEVFARAQLRLLEGAEQAAGRMCPATDRLDFVRSYDQAIALKHHLHLKYPSQLLVAAIGAGLCGMDPDTAAESVIRGRPLPHQLSESQARDVQAAYTQTLSDTPALLPTVREALELARLRDLAVFVMTEGKLERQRHSLTEHDLTQLVLSAWEMPKTQAQFERLRQRFTQAEVVVIGDQLDRDIVPAHRAGCKTVLVPGGFRPRWGDQDAHAADHVAATLLEAVQWAATR